MPAFHFASFSVVFIFDSSLITFTKIYQITDWDGDIGWTGMSKSYTTSNHCSLKLKHYRHSTFPFTTNKPDNLKKKSQTKWKYLIAEKKFHISMVTLTTTTTRATCNSYGEKENLFHTRIALKSADNPLRCLQCFYNFLRQYFFFVLKNKVIFVFTASHSVTYRDKKPL